MMDPDFLSDECMEYLKDTLFSGDLVIPEDILFAPLNVIWFPKDLINGQWCKQNLKDSEQPIKEFALRKLVIHIIRFEENYSHKLKRLGVTLDLCHVIRCNSSADTKDEDKDKVRIWSMLFFDLVRIIIQSLHVPDELLDFFPYLQSRIIWFLQGTESIPPQYGETNLKYGIKLPMSKLLFSINQLFSQVDSSSKLNTPEHYRLISKFQWFLSQLIPMNETCNINKHGEILGRLPENLWDERNAVGLNEYSLFGDYNRLLEKFILNPLEWIFSHPDDRKYIEKCLHQVIGTILDGEKEFYLYIRDIRENSFLDQKQINGSEITYDYYQSEYRVEPYDTRHSILRSKKEFWKRFCNVYSSIDHILQPLPLELNRYDEDFFSDQINSEDVDFYRKLVIIQIMFITNMAKNIMTNEELTSFYSSRYINMNNKMIQYGNKGIKNENTINFLKNLVLKVENFYQTRDPNFMQVVHQLLESDTTYVQNKLSMFKNFDITWNIETLTVPEFDYTFKKFGWIKLGNKKIDDIWKIKSGIDQAEIYSKKNKQTQSELYNFLKEEFGKDKIDLKEKNSNIGKQWQVLRRLRSQYLFKFNKVNESTGIHGLFDDSLIEKSRQLRRNLKQKKLEETTFKHKELYDHAVQYFEQKQLKKMTLKEENNEELDSAKRKLEDSNIVLEDENKKAKYNTDENNEELDSEKRKLEDSNIVLEDENKKVKYNIDENIENTFDGEKASDSPKAVLENEIETVLDEDNQEKSSLPCSPNLYNTDINHETNGVNESEGPE